MDSTQISRSLLQRCVRVRLMRALERGTYYGVVRAVKLHKRTGELLSATVQRPGGERAVTGATYSARCGGETLRLRPEELEAVSWRGRMLPLAEFLRGW